MLIDAKTGKGKYDCQDAKRHSSSDEVPINFANRSDTASRMSVSLCLHGIQAWVYDRRKRIFQQVFSHDLIIA